ncbi:calponin homology domain-containing protein [Pyronema domesticum]|uniref:Similar to Alpha-actinin-like protein 1 acc. no. O13728 n=1 Tax=Pyronema omphalodes (strain CBS 100304) TaxID=1076935 RepID=U4LQQ6_PYROM|nr:calponin homology domain-containing protein [Pyronema domesticum]CCX34270.1 Similar to Alpha-actinin-like protein 1; acc. no. O13728 [Pyronema omphalodes CBS 100304]
MANPQWVNTQDKTFRKWLNSKLSARHLKPVESLKTDLSDGVNLIHLLEILGNESLGKYASNPRLRVQKCENVHKSLEFIKSRGIGLYNIGAEDIVDGNLKLILGLIWTLILRFTITDINAEGLTAKEGLLLWCQRKTACYPGVNVTDFSSSWNDGLAFCALLDIHRPDLIDFDKLDKNDHAGNMALAFKLATEEIGIPALLDVEDVCDVPKPDERSLMTYIAYWFHAFSHLDRIETAGRRVEKFVEVMQGAWDMQHNFEKRMAELLRQIANIQQQWNDATFVGTYTDAKQQSFAFAQYKKTSKRAWVAEKADLMSLLGNIKTKLGTYGLKDYIPPPHLSVPNLDRVWTLLMRAENQRSMTINQKIREIKEWLRKQFSTAANEFALCLNTVAMEISGLDGDPERQLRIVRELHMNIVPLELELKRIQQLSIDCEEANIEENDHTVHSYDDLEYEYGLAKESVTKKLGFLENQIVARNMTNLTPIQLEEWESVFRHFDRDHTNTLAELEFSAALASLGLVYDEDEMHEVFEDVGEGRSSVTFEQFIRFMVEETEDQNSAGQVFQSFREVADGKNYVTEVDLRHSLIPDGMIADLVQNMPEVTLENGKKGYDYEGYMKGLMGRGGDA